MIEVEDLIKLYTKRDKYSEQEQELEDEVFAIDADHSKEDVQRLIREYRKIKDKRSEASIRAAESYMLATPEVRIKTTDVWKTSKEGKRKAGTTGIRGSQK